MARMKRPWLLLLVLLALGVLLYLILPNSRRQQTIADHLTKAAGQETQNPKLKTESPAARRAADVPEFPLNSPASDIQADLRLLSETIETFRSNFPREGNPTGSNSEIT